MMKAAILTNDLNSFYKPLAEGLGRMFARAGVKAGVRYDGLDLLDFSYQPKPYQGDLPRFFSANINRLRKKARQDAFFRWLKDFDLLVVVANNPYAFIRDRLSGIERFRALRPEVPVVQYNYSYLPVAGKGGLYREYFVDGLGTLAFGLERYDHYLMVTASTPQPLPREAQPLSVIGMDLDDGSLYPAQEGFRVLLDFPREGKEAERELVLRVLAKTGIPYTTLSGNYSIKDIRAIYRNSGAYFVSFLESFGFPICELQACGSLIFSPYPSWLYSHSIKEDIHLPGLGRYTDNFIVYENREDLLAAALLKARDTFDAQAVRARFLQEQGAFFRGDMEAVDSFLNAVRQGTIHGGSHQAHRALHQGIDPEDHCPPPW
ncbi:MAG TPA: hypothetical protein P5550_02560 [Bacteroidales bacterium]|nr:hypothetical protein [Bacteroidales bacterium]HRZ76988.1 hypothetical protein [Bacteroidales bacterium]